jgi:predicted site-specific integrase-resolvase
MVYRPHEFAKLIGKSVSTLRRWDSEGKLRAKRSIGNQRYYDEHDLQKALNLPTKIEDRKTIVYCRVSSRGQLDDLKSQEKAMETYCLNAGISVDEWICEIGGGLNFQRKKFLNLMKGIRLGEVNHLIVAHKDRLVRFGFEFIEEFCHWYGCKLTVVNQISLSPQQEMVEDLLSIIHTFSCRLYGLRSYSKKIQETLQKEIK